MARTMLNAHNWAHYFWVEVVDTVCQIANHYLLKKIERRPFMNFDMEENQTNIL